MFVYIQVWFVGLDRIGVLGEWLCRLPVFILCCAVAHGMRAKCDSSVSVLNIPPLTRVWSLAAAAIHDFSTDLAGSASLDREL